ncbi:helix-turn-helix domain-containing protein [Achromobacter xylosoxidans]
MLAAAGELFYNEGIRATGVEAIAARGNTTKMAIYRHFQSKDVLVIEWLRQVIDDYWRALDAIEAAHPDDPRAQIIGWVTYFRTRRAPGRTAAARSSTRSRSCPIRNIPAAN